MPESTKRSLIVTSCEVGYQGTNQKGPYTIYNIGATTEDGGTVGLPLRSFDDLSPNMGRLVEYEVTAFTNKNNETSYTLKGPKTPLTPRVVALEERVAALEEKVAYLARGEAVPRAQPEPSAPGAAPADDDIPF